MNTVNRFSIVALKSPPQRRHFLIGAGALTGAGLLGWNLTQPTNLESQANVLDATLDTIIPRDEFAGALDLGFNQKLRAVMHQKPEAKQRYESLFASIEKTAKHQYRRSFSQLGESDREALLTDLLGSKPQLKVRQDLARLRVTLLTWYYTSAEGHYSVKYKAPNRYPAYPGMPR